MVESLPAAAALQALQLTSLRAGLAFVYHAVSSVPRTGAQKIVPSVDRSNFSAHLRHLGRRYRVVPPSGLLAAVNGRARGDRFPVAITFDDDLREHVQTAAPLLVEAGLPAAFFLTGASLHSPRSFWWERLQWATERGVAPAGLSLGSMGAMSVPEREEMSDELLHRLGGEPPDHGLRAEHIRRLSSWGFEVGFHTRRHERLTRLPDTDLRQALDDGRREIENYADAAVRMIAYPHGDADTRVAVAAAEADYSAGFTTDFVPVLPTTHPMLVGRLYPRESAPGLAFQMVRALLSAYGFQRD